jgi:hypothetical protein
MSHQFESTASIATTPVRQRRVGARTPPRRNVRQVIVCPKYDNPASRQRFTNVWLMRTTLRKKLGE